jgi:hypothetical protein
MQPGGCACYYFEMFERRTWSGEEKQTGKS